MVLVKIAIAILREKPVIATPKAVPLAGGCSVSVATIKNIEMATANEYTMIEERTEGCGMNAANEPERRPTRCPPITLLGSAVIFLGIANTIKAVEPIDAIMTTCSVVRS